VREKGPGVNGVTNFRPGHEKKKEVFTDEGGYQLRPGGTAREVRRTALVKFTAQGDNNMFGGER